MWKKILPHKKKGVQIAFLLFLQLYPPKIMGNKFFRIKFGIMIFFVEEIENPVSRKKKSYFFWK